MQQCPKCGSSVPDGRTTCQICSAELDPEQSKVAGPIGLQTPTAPQRPAEEDDPANRPGIPGIDRVRDEDDVLQKQIGGGAPQASAGGVELRRTLAGDVIEVPVAPPPKAGGPMLGQTSQPGRGPSPIPRRAGPGGSTLPPLRTGRGPVRGIEEGSGGSGSKIGVVLLILVLLLGGGGAGGYWYWQQTRPAAAVTTLMENLKAKNWGGVYDQIELPAQAKQFANRDTFIKVMGVLGANLRIDSYKVERGTITGDTATVKLTVTGKRGSESGTDTTEVPLRKVEGVWKIDVTAVGKALPGLAPKL